LFELSLVAGSELLNYSVVKAYIFKLWLETPSIVFKAQRGA
jgi:hypothetical protein